MKEKTLTKSRILIGAGTSALAKLSVFVGVLQSEQAALERIAEALGGEAWVIAVGFGIALGGDMLAMWARVDDHLKGRTK